MFEERHQYCQIEDTPHLVVLLTFSLFSILSKDKVMDLICLYSKGKILRSIVQLKVFKVGF